MFKTLLMSALCLLGVAAAAPTMNIVQLASNTTDLSTLVTAVGAGGLVDTLSGPGPFTVFAPTNEAFAKLPKATLDFLLDPKNIKDLDAVLTYHVVSGAVHSTDLKKGWQEVKSVEGSELRIYVERSGTVLVDDAHVTTANVDASNGVVHIIDRVLIPTHVAVKIQAMNIVELASATPDLSTLVTAVGAGGLVDTLSGAGPFTVFAPTNEAFAKLPKATLDFLLDPKNIKDLDAVLTYHVVSGAVHSTDLKQGEQSVKSVEGSTLRIFVEADGKVYVDRAHVTTANVDASNGVVHIIDRVLIPPHVAVKVQAAKNIVELAEATPDLSTLVAAVVAGKLADTLSGPGPFTVFAPTNEAFAKLPAATLKRLLDPAHIKELDAVLTYHVVAGAVHSTDLKPEQDVKSVEGSELRIVVRGGKVYVDRAQVTTADVDASNGVVHIIDRVLIPYH